MAGAADTYLQSFDLFVYGRADVVDAAGTAAHLGCAAWVHATLSHFVGRAAESASAEAAARP